MDGASLEAFTSDDLLQSAVKFQFLIIGEATRHIDQTMLDKYPYLDRENVAIFGWVGKCVISTLIFFESLAFLFSNSPVTHSYEIYLFFLLRPALS